MNDYKEYNQKFLTKLGLNIDHEEEGITFWYVSGGKTMATLHDEKITIKNVLNRYGAARFEEGQDDIRSEIKFLLKING